MELPKDKWHKIDGAETAAIKNVEMALTISLPEQYKSFLLWSNGGEGVLDNNYMYIWAIDDVIAYNKDYEIQKYLGTEYLAFGMDGDIGYVFYLPNNNVYKVNFGDLDIESIAYLASCFDEFLGKAIY